MNMGCMDKVKVSEGWVCIPGYRKHTKDGREVRKGVTYKEQEEVHTEE